MVQSNRAYFPQSQTVTGESYDLLSAEYHVREGLRDVGLARYELAQLPTTTILQNTARSKIGFVTWLLTAAGDEWLALL